METVLNQTVVYAVRLNGVWYNGYTNLEHAEAHKSHFDNLEWLNSDAEIVTFQPGELKQSAYGTSFLPVEVEEDPMANNKFAVLDQLSI